MICSRLCFISMILDFNKSLIFSFSNNSILLYSFFLTADLKTLLIPISKGYTYLVRPAGIYT